VRRGIYFSALVSPQRDSGRIPVEYLTHLSGFNDSYLAELRSIQVVGEFLSAPAITVADAATLGYLDDDVAIYCDESVCLSVCLSPVHHPWLLGRRRRQLLL